MNLNELNELNELNDQELKEICGGNPLLEPVPGSGETIPAGGPRYGFFQPPPAAPIAFQQVFENLIL